MKLLIAVFTFYLNVSLGKFPDGFLPLPLLSPLLSSLLLSSSFLASPLLCSAPSACTLLTRSKHSHFLVPSRRDEPRCLMDGGTRASLGTRASSRLFRSIAEAECFIVCTSASPCVPCVPEITVPKIPLIVSWPRAGRRAVDLRAAERSGRRREKKGTVCRTRGPGSTFFSPSFCYFG